MIGFIFIVFASGLIIFNLIINIRLKQILVHDESMFRMARFRGELVNFLLLKYHHISKQDASDVLNLINNASFTISNHKLIYKDKIKFNDLSKAVQITIKEVKVVNPIIGQIKNKSIKRFYIKFGLILIENIIDNTKFKNIKIRLFVYKILLKSKLLNLLNSFDKTKLSFINLIKGTDWLIEKNNELRRLEQKIC